MAPKQTPQCMAVWVVVSQLAWDMDALPETGCLSGADCVTGRLQHLMSQQACLNPLAN